MAKIPFTLEAWLKDKSQRVETRDGRIVHDIWEVKNAVTAKEYRTEVCALIEGEEDALVFFKNGKYLPVNAESPYDLFIVTPEQELTEFEKAVKNMMRPYVSMPDDIYKEEAVKLLNLARKEIMDEWSKGLRDTQDCSGKAYNDGYNLGFVIGYKRGKTEILKDLPKWRISRAMRSTLPITMYGNNGMILYKDGFEVSISDLEKLPKED